MEEGITKKQDAYDRNGVMKKIDVRDLPFHKNAHHFSLSTKTHPLMGLNDPYSAHPPLPSSATPRFNS